MERKGLVSEINAMEYFEDVNKCRKDAERASKLRTFHCRILSASILILHNNICL